MFGVQWFRGLLWHTPQGAKRIMNLHDVGFDWNRFKHACSVDTCTKRTLKLHFMVAYSGLGRWDSPAVGGALAVSDLG